MCEGDCDGLQCEGDCGGVGCEGEREGRRGIRCAGGGDGVMAVRDGEGCGSDGGVNGSGNGLGLRNRTAHRGLLVDGVRTVAVVPGGTNARSGAWRFGPYLVDLLGFSPHISASTWNRGNTTSKMDSTPLKHAGVYRTWF